ncbi:rhodanese-like domain-containing protein [Mariniflexile litorale]|uniref:Rhodanese-like domain-containing protein n=1 Tax=Mariniflexile litorale TaxID=3045158 RepID=A0AAU7EBQ9_9FLAO|nr:rhodanese-like domain-containing protein [Mariniflexile sp. KMM 9835]MDQ8212830.1 rhodanese-like domain-containing protein [Mariniflexile sp. KMM 9835]
MTEITLSHPVVSVSWLHDNLEADNLVVLDGTINKVFDTSQSQIPKTRLFDIKNKFSNTLAPFPSTFPAQEQFQKEARALGINKESAIVVYDDKGIYSSARVWWLFKAFGYNNVAVLDGGLPAWKKAGFLTESMKAYIGKSGNFEAVFKPELMKFFEDIKIASETKSHTIIDARSEGRFKSLEAEPRVGLRMGTIPNSMNLPFEDLLTDNQLLPNEIIETKFKNLAQKEEPIIFSCGSGITACVLALGATISGYNNIAVYDGSWTEWGSLVEEE